MVILLPKEKFIIIYVSTLIHFDLCFTGFKLKTKNNELRKLVICLRSSFRLNGSAFLTLAIILSVTGTFCQSKDLVVYPLKVLYILYEYIYRDKSEFA